MTPLARAQESFTSRLPRMQRYAVRCFAHLDPDRRQEAVQNTLGHAWKAYYTLFQQGRLHDDGILVSILVYAVRRTRCGRTIQGTNGRVAKDVVTYRDRGRVGFETVDLDGLISSTTPVPEQVSFRVDIPRLLAMLRPRDRQFAHDLATGMTATEVARRHAVSNSTLTKFRKRFRALYESFDE